MTRIYAGKMDVELNDQYTMPSDKTPSQFDCERYVDVHVEEYRVQASYVGWDDGQKSDFISSATLDFRRHLTKAVCRIRENNRHSVSVIEKHESALRMMRYVEENDIRSLSGLIGLLEADIEDVNKITRYK